MNEVTANAPKLPFEAGWKRALLEYRQAALWYVTIVFLNLCALAAVFYTVSAQSVLNVRPWLLTNAVALCGFIVGLLQERKLKVPILYMGYFALAGSVQFIAFFARPRDYAAIFWIAEFLHDCLLCVLSVEVLSVILPRKYVIFWTVPALVLLVGRVAVGLPSSYSNVFLDLASSASFIGGALLLLLLFVNVKWTREEKMVTAGIIALLLSEMLGSLEMTARHASAVMAIQLTPLIGLLLLTFAGSRRQRTRLLVKG